MENKNKEMADSPKESAPGVLDVQPDVVSEVKPEVKPEVISEPEPVEEGPDWKALGPQLQAKLDALTGDFEAYKASVSLGVTDWEAFEVVKWQWDKGDKSKDMPTWLEDMMTGKTQVPKVIVPFIKKAEVAPVTPASTKISPQVVAPTTVAGQNITAKVSSQALAEARRKASLGDATELRLLLGREKKN